MEPEMVMWIYIRILSCGAKAKDLTVAVPSIGDPFHGRNISLHQYIRNIKDGW